MINKLVFIDKNDEATIDYFVRHYKKDNYIFVAGSGYSNLLRYVDNVLKKEKDKDKEECIVTNSLDVFANTKIKFAINDFSRYYIVQKDLSEKPITELYGTNIRPINALDKMYKAGVFSSGVYIGEDNA